MCGFSEGKNKMEEGEGDQNNISLSASEIN